MKKTRNFIKKYFAIIIKIPLITLLSYLIYDLLRDNSMLTKEMSIFYTAIIVAVIIITEHIIIPFVTNTYKKIYCMVARSLTRIDETVIAEHRVEYCYKNVKVLDFKDISIKSINYIIKRKESETVDRFISQEVEIKEENTEEYIFRCIQQHIYRRNKLRAEDIRYQLVVPLGCQIKENWE